MKSSFEQIIEDWKHNRITMIVAVRRLYQLGYNGWEILPRV